MLNVDVWGIGIAFAIVWVLLTAYVTNIMYPQIQSNCEYSEIICPWLPAYVAMFIMSVPALILCFLMRYDERHRGENECKT